MLFQRRVSDTRVHSTSPRWPFGAEVRPYGGVLFRVWAPAQRRAAVILEDASGLGLLECPLQPETGGYFSAVVAKRSTACSIASASAAPARPFRIPRPASSRSARTDPRRSWIRRCSSGLTMNGPAFRSSVRFCTRCTWGRSRRKAPGVPPSNTSLPLQSWASPRSR